MENLNQSLDEMKEIIKSDNIDIQMDSAKYHWTTKVFQFYYEKRVKLVDWPPYSPDLNLIENVLSLMKRKISGRKHTLMNSQKKNFTKYGQISKLKQLRKYE